MDTSMTRNTVIMTIASIGQKLISFAFFAFLARSLGALDTGKYFFAFSFTGIFVVFADVGLSNLLVREGARSRDRLQDYLSTVLGAKIILGFLAYIIMESSLFVLGYGADTMILVSIAGLTMLFDTFQLTIYSALRAIGKLRFEAVGMIITQTTSAILGSIFIIYGLPLPYILSAFTLASAVNAVYVSLVIVRLYGLKPLPHFVPERTLRFIRLAVPFAMAALFARILGSADSIFLSKLSGDAAVGVYSVPVKIASAFQFIPMAITASVYPRMSEYFATEREQISELFVQSLRYLLMIAFPVAVGLIIISGQMIPRLFSREYANSIAPLAILLIGLCFSFASFPIGTLLNAGNRQGAQTKIVGLAMLASLALNTILIPSYGVVGAALSSLTANLIMAVVGYFNVSKIIALPHGRVLALVGRLILCSFIMGLIIYAFLQIIPWPGLIPLGVGLYVALLFWTKTLTFEELRTIRQRL